MAYQPPRGTLEAYLRIRDLRMIVLSSVVHRIIQHRINNPGQYPYPTYDHAPTSTSRRPTTVSEIDQPRTWRIHRDQLYNNYNLNPHAPEFSSLNPYAPEFRSLDPHAPEITSLNPYAPEFIVHDPNPNTSRDEEMYEELKTRKTREEDEVEANVCVVCLHDLSEKENDEDEETIATLTCGHEYHVHCIKSWLRRKNVCPLCNAVALPRR